MSHLLYGSKCIYFLIINVLCLRDAFGMCSGCAWPTKVCRKSHVSPK